MGLLAFEVSLFIKKSKNKNVNFINGLKYLVEML